MSIHSMNSRLLLLTSQSFLFLASIALCQHLSVKPLYAQENLVPPIKPPDLETPQTIPTPFPEDLLKPFSLPSTPTEEFPSEIPETIRVERFEFVGNTVFSEEELAEITQPFTKRRISFTELLQARSAITQFYIDQGYVTSGAYIPPQTIEQGVITIKILEGSLEEINVSVNGRLRTSYVRDRLAIASGPPFNVNRLLEALQLLQLDPLIAKISAELSAGTHPGVNILNVTVETNDSFRTEILLDNGRSPSVGEFRRGIQISEANLLGYGDNLRAWYLNTDGSDDWDVTYTVPINPYNGTVSFEYRNVSSRVIEPPLDVLDINSNYEDYQVTFRQPIRQTPNYELAFGLSFEHQRSKIRFRDGQPFPSIGADEQGRTNLSTLRVFQEWSQRNEREVIAFRSEFSFGFDAFGTTDPIDFNIDANTPNGNYFLWRGQAQWVRLLAPDLLFLVRTDLQLADGPLIPLEQFAIGGLNSVRGYRQNFLLTDNGLFASAEVRLPIYRAPEQKQLVQLIPFVDVGTGWNSFGIVNPNPQTLLSVGIGIQWQYDRRLSARIDWGIPLIEVPSGGNTWQDSGVVFSIIISPF